MSELKPENKVIFSDGGWPELSPEEHAVTELLSNSCGPLSPFGDINFPVPSEELPYIHPYTIVNK